MTKDQKIQLHFLYAQWHMHSATNGHCTTRRVMKGRPYRLLTPEELRDDAMNSAMSHIETVNRIIEIPDEEWGKSNDD